MRDNNWRDVSLHTVSTPGHFRSYAKWGCVRPVRHAVMLQTQLLLTSLMLKIKCQLAEVAARKVEGADALSSTP